MSFSTIMMSFSWNGISAIRAEVRACLRGTGNAPIRVFVRPSSDPRHPKLYECSKILHCEKHASRWVKFAGVEMVDHLRRVDGQGGSCLAMSGINRERLCCLREMSVRPTGKLGPVNRGYNVVRRYLRNELHPFKNGSESQRSHRKHRRECQFAQVSGRL